MINKIPALVVAALIVVSAASATGLHRGTVAQRHRPTPPTPDVMLLENTPTGVTPYELNASTADDKQPPW